MQVMSGRPFDRHNNYVTAFHLASRPPVKVSQPCAILITDMGSVLCGLLNARRRVTITYRHTDATDSPMFSLAPMLPMSDVLIGVTLLLLLTSNLWS